MPWGIWIISFLHYVSAVIFIVLGALLIFSRNLINSMFGIIGISIPDSIFIVAFVLFVGFGVLNFYVGRDLRRKENWARMTSITLSSVGILFSLGGMVFRLTYGEIGFSGIESIIINGLIIWYLGFSQQGKNFFRKIKKQNQIQTQEHKI